MFAAPGKKVFTLLCARGTRPYFLATLAFSGFSALVVWHVFRFSALAFDDAYIHMRIARNLVEHGAPYFNLSEKVMGSSPHLWIVLIALAFKLFGVGETAVVLLSAASGAAAIGGTAAILALRAVPVKAVTLAFLLYAIFLQNVTAGLMESSLALALFVASWFFAERGKASGAGFLAALAIGARYELCLWLAALFFAISKDRRPAYIIGAIFPSAALFAYCLVFYGTLVPFPMTAKREIFPAYAAEYFQFFRWPDLRPLLGISSAVNHDIGTALHILGWLTAIICAIVLMQESIRGRLSRASGAVLVSALGLLLVYGLVFRVSAFQWYKPLFIFPFAVVATQTSLGGKKFTRWILPLFLFGAANWVEFAARDFAALLSGNNSLHRYYSLNSRTDAFKKIGATFSGDFSEGKVLAHEIGGLGWTYAGEIYDSMALVSPTALPHYRSEGVVALAFRPPTIPIGLVREVRPRWIVCIPLFLEPYLRAMGTDPSLPRYRLFRSVPIFPDANGRIWGEDKIGVFVAETP